MHALQRGFGVQAVSRLSSAGGGDDGLTDEAVCESRMGASAKAQREHASLH